MDVVKCNLSSFMLYFIVLISFSFKFHFCFAANKLSADESFSGDQTLSSENGSFTLGFFNPGNSSNYYIGIWYSTNLVAQQTVVWVANREKPVSDKYDSQFRILNGNLVLTNASGGIVWSSNLSLTNSNSSEEAVLLDEGNLVLRSESNSSEPLWQSFDHPTDTWLPGARLGFNKLTKETTRLTSWKSKEDPAPGPFSLELDLNGTSQFLLRNRSRLHWITGTWDGQIFRYIPELRWNKLNEFSYVSNDAENYFTYSRKNFSPIMWFVLDFGGQLQQHSLLEPSKQWQLLWAQPRVQCEVYAFCGAFSSCTETDNMPVCRCLEGFQPNSVEEWNGGNYSAGCIRKTSLLCGNSSRATGKKDRFSEIRNVALPINSNIAAEAQNGQECESTCLNNCSCIAYAYSNVANYGSIDCSIWTESLLNIQQLPDDNSNTNSLHVRLAASEFSSSNNAIVIGVAVGLSLLLMLLILFLVWFMIRRRTRMEKEKAIASMAEITNPPAANEGKENNGQLVIFSFKTILTATDNFSPANMLGKGGFGPVYKGNFPGDKKAGIKRLSKRSGQGLEEFMNELKLIANLQHKYLVRLLGCCVENDEKILIYEYMANRSLDKFLYDPSERQKLVWEKRLSIAEGVAQGLLYLHKYSRLKIIHRDLKASNILLDEAMNPKISDFGMARIFGMNQTEANTNRVMGTYGYMSPEYAFSGQFSEKSDVFSFGVFLLEIVSGKRNTSFHRSGLSFTLISWAWELWKERKEEELIDELIKDTCCIKEAVKCIHVGLLCIQDDPIDRPTMSSVILMLSSDNQTLLSPKEPAFLTRRVEDSARKPHACSDNAMTISLAEGR